MSTSVGAIHYDLSLDTSKFETQSALIKNKLNGLNDKFSSFASTVGSASLKASAGLAALGVVLSPIIKDAVARVDTLNNAPKVLQNLGFSAEDSAASMKLLDKSIRGLPTSLDDATTALLQITAASGRSIQESTKLTVAFNNMALAGSRGPQEAQRALIQFTQALGRGKMGMQEFNTLSEIMPAQLQQVAKTTLGAGANIATLREALGDGTLTMSQFADAIVNLNSQGGNGFASFEQQARTATGGINTAFTNMKTAMTRGMAEIIKSIGASNISDALNNIGKSLEKVFKFIANNVDVVAIFIGVVLTGAFISLSYAVLSATWPILAIAAAITAGYMIYKRYQTGINQVVQKLKDLWNATRGVREFLVNQFAAAWRDLVAAFQRVKQALQPFMEQLKWLAIFIVGVLLLPFALFAAAIGVIVAVAYVLIIAFARLIGWLAQLLAWTIQVGAAILRFFVGIPAAVANFFSSAWSWLINAGRNIIQGLWNGMSAIWNGLVGWLSGIGGSILRTVGNLAGILWNAGWHALNSLFAGMKNAWNNVTGWLSSLANKIRNLKGPIDKDKVMLLAEGKAVMQGFNKGLVAGYKDVESTLSGITASMAQDNTIAAGSIGGAVPANNTLTTNNNIYGNITLGDKTAVDTFFNKLDRNGELARKGMATI